MGLYDIQLDEPRPRFCQERQKKKSLFANSAYFSSCPVPIPPRFQSRREDGEGALNRLRSPCHALAFTRVRTRVRSYIRTAAACATSDAQLTSSAVRRHGSQARYAAGADGLEEENFRSSSDYFGTISD